MEHVLPALPAAARPGAVRAFRQSAGGAAAVRARLHRGRAAASRVAHGGGGADARHTASQSVSESPAAGHSARAVVGVIENDHDGHEHSFVSRSRPRARRCRVSRQPAQPPASPPQTPARPYQPRVRDPEAGRPERAAAADAAGSARSTSSVRRTRCRSSSRTRPTSPTSTASTPTARSRCRT